MSPSRKKLTLACLVAALAYCCFASAICAQVSASGEISEEEMRASIKAFVVARDDLNAKASAVLKQKELRDREIRNQIAGEPPLETPEISVSQLRLAQEGVKEMFAEGRGLVQSLCFHLDVPETGGLARGASFRVTDFYMTANTLVTIDPQTAKAILSHSHEFDEAKIQHLVGAILQELDGAELAKARLEIKIKELGDAQKGDKELTAKAIANLQAIRKLFDKKDAFRIKRLGS